MSTTVHGQCLLNKQEAFQSDEANRRCYYFLNNFKLPLVQLIIGELKATICCYPLEVDLDFMLALMSWQFCTSALGSAHEVILLHDWLPFISSSLLGHHGVTILYLYIYFKFTARPSWGKTLYLYIYFLCLSMQ